MDDEAFYSQVAQELQQRGPAPGLWAKAFAESDGGESRARALYLRLRVAQLRADHEKAEADGRAQVEAAQRESDASKRVTDDQERARLQVEYTESQKRRPVWERDVSTLAIFVLIVVAILTGLYFGLQLPRRP